VEIKPIFTKKRRVVVRPIAFNFGRDKCKRKITSSSNKPFEPNV
jgi:hypothetical protein